MGCIAWAQKVEPVGGEGGRSHRAVSCQQNRLHPFGGVFVLPHGNQAAHDVADHVVQEGVGFELKAPIGASLGDFDAL